MRSPSPRTQPDVVNLYKWRPGQDPDAGAVADETSLIVANVPCSVQQTGLRQEEHGKRIRQVWDYKVEFDTDYGLNQKDLIAYTNPAGNVRSLLVVGTLDPVGDGVAIEVLATEAR